MRLLLSAAIVLCAISSVLAQVAVTGAGRGVLPGSVTGGGGGGACGAGACWVQTDQIGNLDSGGTASTYTWTNANIGTPNANRLVVLFWNGATTVASTVTIGGVNASRAVRESSIISGFDIWYASVASGATANIVISAGGNMTLPIAIVGNLRTTTPATFTTAANANNLDPNSVTLVVPTNGVGLAGVGTAQNVASSITWQTATKDATLSNTTAMAISQAHVFNAGSQVLQESNATTSNHMIGAAWGP